MALIQMIDRLNRLEASTVDSTLNQADLMGELHDIYAKGHLKEILTELIIKPSTPVFGSFHDNGFVKLPIARSNGGRFSVRLHDWIDGHNHQNVHDHRFNFASLIISGQIKNCIWNKSRYGEIFHYYKFTSHLDGGRCLNYQGTAQLKCENDHVTTNVNDIYFMDRCTLHTIEYFGSPKTIILEDRKDLRPFAKVFSNSVLEKSGRYTPRKMGNEAVRLMTTSMLEFL